MKMLNRIVTLLWVVYLVLFTMGILHPGRPVIYAMLGTIILSRFNMDY